MSSSPTDFGPPTSGPLADLLALLKDAATLKTAADTLAWDEQTYLPDRGGDFRADQLAALAGLTHDRLTGPALNDALLAAEGEGFPDDSAAAACVREARRDFDRRTTLPRQLVEELSRVTTLAQRNWAEARKAADFAAFRPHLSAVVKLKREEAAAVAAGRTDLADRPAYDALLDDYEPGASSEQVAAVFAELRDGLVPLVHGIAESNVSPDRSILSRNYPIAAQDAFCRSGAEELGFDFEAGRLDTAAHPFCTTLGPADCRLTTRYNVNDFSQSYFGVLHEAGHGIYEQGLPAEWFGAPPGEACGLGVHESQSRLWENFVGRSAPYWKHVGPQARAAFPEQLENVSDDDLYRVVNDVRPTLIRVEADEVTYNLHVLLRFELEQALISGDLPVADVSDVWDEKFDAMFGFRPPSPADGCLQDIHWAAGLIGYFPTYALGNVYAAMLWNAAQKELGDLDDQLAGGNFAPLRGWLTDKIYRHGRRYAPTDLIERAAGSPPVPGPLLTHLREKYGALYGLN
ncbi:carboxypeptidase M32 [Alienimonas chondri]|uniref:Metal-dependent carboxypeptidase n=1 Tax=Alienimonas chondri TaxID=2681879 RepID=A0ABX1VDT4_9PLAN|nr:carboxypeptidase M32 [Alienimonas chondri]NNJ25216.1 Thermostable carboxypeptidase 1 [Alienimonas chondri]